MKFVIAAIAAAVLATCAPAQTGSAAPAKQDKPLHQHRMNAKEVSMQGLSADEKKTADDMMKHWSKAERKVWEKRENICMRDPHTMLKGMDPSKITEEMQLQHMLSGLSVSEQATMKAMLMKLTPAQKPVVHKMAMNCCMYGMEHAKPGK
jgi:hypothetical protein